MNISKTTRKALLVAGAWPALLAVSAGVAAANPGQPGVAAPGAGQPGVSIVPQPAAPVAPAAPAVVAPAAPSASLADWAPDPQVVMPLPTWRPRPQQQQAEPQQSWYVPDTTADDSTAADTPADAVSVPAAAPVDPHTLRLGTTVVGLPAGVDQRAHDKAQAYVDVAEWNLAALGDRMGLPSNESDRMAAAALGGGVVGAPVGALVAAPVGAVTGCGVGALVGAAAGALIGGIPTAGALALPGAGIGAAIGCGVGAASGGLTFGLAGGVAGGLIGAGGGAVIGGADQNVKLPTDVPPLVDAPEAAPMPPAPADPVAANEVQAAAPIAAPMPAPVVPAVEQVAAQVVDTVDQAVAADPGLDSTVGSLRDAVAALPLVSADQLGGFAAPVNDVLAAVQAAVAGN
ncbi:hypothetical protein [Nocardia heshunensis]